MDLPDQNQTHKKGPWSFVTRRTYRSADGAEHVWTSRRHRKGPRLRDRVNREEFMAKLRTSAWLPKELNWWIAILFAIGALLFLLATVLCLVPELARAWSLEIGRINLIYFLGSIPFTIAAYLQLFQASNAGDFAAINGTKLPLKTVVFGWKPGDIGWLGCSLQFVGTILFNFNTFDAMAPSLNWFQEDLLVWVPNIAGSILFLISGHLAFVEVCHSFWAWRPRTISWWVVIFNLLGCIGFILSAAFAVALPGPAHIEAAALSLWFMLMGACGFLIGSLLMLPEAV